MEKKLLIISLDELNQQRKKDFKIAELNIKFEVIYICIKKLFFDKDYLLKLDSNNNYNINSFKELIGILKANQNSVVLTDIKVNKNIINFLLFILFIKKYTRKVYFLDKGEVFNHILFKDTIKYKLKELLNYLIYDKLFTQIGHKHDVFSKYVRINNMKYDKDNKNNSSQKDFILFIDSGFTNHPDLDIYMENNYLNERYYLQKLNELFNKLEKKYNKEIVVALHPKSNYKSRDFNYRKVIKNNTTELIKRSALVLAHSSTSIFNAVELSKPIIFLYSEKMLKTNVKKWVEATINYSKLLNSELLNLDNYCLDNINLDINKSRYELFKEKYLYNIKTKHKDNHEIISNFLERHFLS
jgi:hypothetical protein